MVGLFIFSNINCRISEKKLVPVIIVHYFADLEEQKLMT